ASSVLPRELPSWIRVSPSAIGRSISISTGPSSPVNRFRCTGANSFESMTSLNATTAGVARSMAPPFYPEGLERHVRYNRGQEEQMARLPLTEQEVSATKVVIKFGKVGLTDEQFWQLCRDNGDFDMELTAQKELIIMPPVGVNSAW